MPRGRPRKPTELKIIAGKPSVTPGKSRAAAPPVVLSVKPPESLGEIAQREWDRVAPILAGARVLRDTDLQMLVNYCLAKETRDAAQAAMDETRRIGGDPYTQETPNGMRIESAELRVRNGAMKDMAAYGARLGLDPVSRAGLASDAADAQDDLDEFRAAPRRRAV